MTLIKFKPRKPPKFTLPTVYVAGICRMWDGDGKKRRRIYVIALGGVPDDEGIVDTHVELHVATHSERSSFAAITELCGKLGVTMPTEYTQMQDTTKENSKWEPKTMPMEVPKADPPDIKPEQKE